MKIENFIKKIIHWNNFFKNLLKEQSRLTHLFFTFF